MHSDGSLHTRKHFQPDSNFLNNPSFTFIKKTPKFPFLGQSNIQSKCSFSTPMEERGSRKILCE